ncbi:MAG TPA: sigma-70 family RNA polymerase sigma factor [Ktedonobacterales bacterium]|jgi:RNA polymerase sigma factor (sigma-70 family)
MKDASAPRMLAPGAFGDLLNCYQWPLFSFLRGFISDTEQARDIVQDVFCDAWRVSQRAVAPFDGQGEGAEEGIRRWLFNAAYWRAISALRRRRLIRWESLDAITEQHGEISLLMYPFEDAVLEGAVLRDVFATLSPEAVALLLLNIVHGFTAAEIAEITGISTEAAKKRLTRAKQRLRAGYLTRNPRSQETHGP